MSKRRSSSQAESRETNAKNGIASKGGNGSASLALHCEPHSASQGWFTWFAHTIARFAGKPATFLTALAAIVIWAITGPLFGFSDTWQLVVNTATTIVTFLMVFLIQNTQNRDTMALQIKLAELIIAVRGAHNSMALAEDLDDEELEALHEEYRKRAEQTHDSLEQRRSARGET
jgi:low affinity Fe/Cu permease